MSQENQDYCYFDIQGLEGMGIIFNGKRVVFTGISVYTELEKYRDNEILMRFLNEDFHFFFDDNVPKLDFYAVPALWIIGYDSAAGYFATTETDFSFQEDFPLFYISVKNQVYLIKGGSALLLTGEYHWRENLEQSGEVRIYPSRGMADKDFDIHDAGELTLLSREPNQ